MKPQKKFDNSIIRDNEDSGKQFENSIIRDNEDSENNSIIRKFGTRKKIGTKNSVTSATLRVKNK